MVLEDTQLHVEVGDKVSGTQRPLDLHTPLCLDTFLRCVRLVPKGVEGYLLRGVNMHRTAHCPEFALPTASFDTVKVCPLLPSPHWRGKAGTHPLRPNTPCISER